jgi:hypothetical protein
MCAEEFSSFLSKTREAPLKDKVKGFIEIVEKI